MPDSTLRGRLTTSLAIPGIRYRFDGVSDHLSLIDEGDEESVVLDFGEQINLLGLLVKEYPDLAEACLKEVRRLQPTKEFDDDTP